MHLHGHEIPAESVLLGFHQRITADELAEIVRRNPEIIFGSWCGKKFRPDNVAARAGWAEVAAVRHQQLFESKSPDILQPGPAALTDGVRKLHACIMQWMDKDLQEGAPA
jgi:iron complex transport system substrate-binding protein